MTDSNESQDQPGGSPAAPPGRSHAAERVYGSPTDQQRAAQQAAFDASGAELRELQKEKLENGYLTHAKSERMKELAAARMSGAIAPPAKSGLDLGDPAAPWDDANDIPADARAEYAQRFEPARDPSEYRISWVSLPEGVSSNGIADLMFALQIPVADGKTVSTAIAEHWDSETYSLRALPYDPEHADTLASKAAHDLGGEDRYLADLAAAKKYIQATLPKKEADQTLSEIAGSTLAFDARFVSSIARLARHRGIVQ